MSSATRAPSPTSRPKPDLDLPPYPPATLPRSSGVLLHPTSLPGPFGIGDLGPIAYRWVETLAAMKQTWWQVLPLGPTGAGDSPYQSFSAFAGNVNLLSPDLLAQDGLVSPEGWAGRHFPADHVDYARVTPFKDGLVREAWDAFRGGSADHLRADFEWFCEREKDWLADYALFTAVRDSLGGAGLLDWPDDLRRRDPDALAAAGVRLANEVGRHRFGQYLFDRQWTALKDYAADRYVSVMGDVPIFVAHDSADVWAHADEFLLDRSGKPTVVAGVPPDYFSEDGQHWGNPIYDWDRMAATGYSWWVARMRRTLKQVDLVRLDHFRGFRQAWHIPAADTNARNGEWVDGPGADLFRTLRRELGGLPFVAEDLGLITPDVDALRTGLGLPGMKVLMFAVDTPANPYWPHNYEPHSVCYTGTHDNDTTNGWHTQLNAKDKNYLGDYLGHALHEPAWDLIRLAWSSVSCVAVAPLQDLLGLGSDARMNKPGVPSGNWRWRFRIEQFPPSVVGRLKGLTELYNRDTTPKAEDGNKA